MTITVLEELLRQLYLTYVDSAPLPADILPLVFDHERSTPCFCLDYTSQQGGECETPQKREKNGCA